MSYSAIPVLVVDSKIDSVQVETSSSEYLLSQSISRSRPVDENRSCHTVYSVFVSTKH